MRTSKGKVHSSFRQNWEGTWNDLIADPGDTKSKHCWWQGKNAYKELVASGCIPAVLPGNGTPMIRFLLQHLRFHRRFVSDALAQNKAHRAGIDAFRQARSIFSRKALKAGPLKDELVYWASYLWNAEWEFRQQLSSVPSLLPYDPTRWLSSDRSLCHLDPYHRMLMFPILPVPPQEILEAEHVFRSVRLPSNYTSRANLETWLQIRAAVVFKVFLTRPNRKLSLLTASRLVVLFYGCAGRGAPINNTNGNAYVSLAHTRRKLTVTGLYQKLQRYGVDKVALGTIRIQDVFQGPQNSGGPVAA